MLGVYVAVWVGNLQESGTSACSCASRALTRRRGQLAELIDPTLLFELCFYYDERDGLGQKFVRYAVFTENEVLPRLKGPPKAFYTDDGTRLAPAFESHVDRLREWRRDLATLQTWAQCLDNRLNDPSKPGGSCRPTVGGTIDVGGPKQ